MRHLETHARKKLEGLKKLNLLRHPVPNEERHHVSIKRNGKSYIDFSSNDYLALSSNKQVIHAAQKALKRYGNGGCSSRYISGDTKQIRTLEQNIADFKQTEDCILFGSGYLANIGIIPALVRKTDLILMDQLSHASMIDGARLSGADIKFFHHNDITHLTYLLKTMRSNFRNALILTETVFSMDGDLAPLDHIAMISKQYQAWLMTDDAHGFGLLGKGRGGVHAFSPIPDIPIQMGTLSKAIGAYGGYVCSSKIICQFLRNKCRSAIYSTALPPSIIASAITALDLIRNNLVDIQKPIKNADYFCQLTHLPSPQTPIIPILLKTEEKAINAQKILEQEGFLGIAIRPPTVPKGTSRLRLTFSCAHQKTEIKTLASLILNQKII